MTEDQKYEIAVLAEDYDAKRRRYEALGMLNSYGLTSTESAQRSIEYHVAHAEKLEAWSQLENAKQKLVRS